MTKAPVSLVPALALLLGINPPIPAQMRQESSPQQKIIKKHGLEQRLKDNRWEDIQEKNTDCHQPSNKGPEKKSYDIFRQVLKNTRGMDDTLLMVCKATLGMTPDVVHAHSRTDSSIVKVTEAFTNLPPKQQKAILGHELTHIHNEDKVAYPPMLPEVQRFIQFEQQAQTAIALRQRAGIPLSAQEAGGLLRMESALQKEAERAINISIDKNHQNEISADVGGLIFAAGKSCKLDPQSMIDGIKAMLETLPPALGQGTLTHPSFKRREAQLSDNIKEIQRHCRDYYNEIRKPDKRPPRGR